MPFLHFVFQGSSPTVHALGSGKSLGSATPALIRIFDLLLELATRDGWFFRLVYQEAKGLEAAVASWDANQKGDPSHLVVLNGEAVLTNLSASMLRKAVDVHERIFFPGTTEEDLEHFSVQPWEGGKVHPGDLAAFCVIPRSEIEKVREGDMPLASLIQILELGSKKSNQAIGTLKEKQDQTEEVGASQVGPVAEEEPPIVVEEIEALPPPSSSDPPSQDPPSPLSPPPPSPSPPPILPSKPRRRRRSLSTTPSTPLRRSSRLNPTSV